MNMLKLLHYLYTMQAAYRGYAVRKYSAVLHPKLAAFIPLSLAAGPAALLQPGEGLARSDSRRVALQEAVRTVHAYSCAPAPVCSSTEGI